MQVCGDDGLGTDMTTQSTINGLDTGVVREIYIASAAEAGC